MAVAEQSKFFINLTGGLNTDATNLNFPENAATDLDNVDIFRTGEARRRRGVEFENGYQLSNQNFDSSINTSAISLHEWRAVNGKADVNFLGVQVGSKVIFHDAGTELLSNNVIGEIDIEPFAQGNGVPGDSLLDSSYGQGVMVLTNPNMDPVIVTYDDESKTFNTERIEILIRDFEGEDDGLEVDERPTSLSPQHEYNLRNQGWPKEVDANNSRKGNDGITKNVDPISFTRTKIGEYPSNADIIYVAKAPSASDAEVIGTYSPFHLSDTIFGNTPAPKGHFIYNVFDQNRSTVSGIPGLTAKAVQERPTVTAFYAGRVWYAGVPNSELVGNVFFSQSLTDVSNAGKCYQDQDPTAEDFNLLVATDGGVIHIADMGEVYRMIPVGQDLVLIAFNGIWAISGTSGGSFAANDFTVRKITDIGTTSAYSVLEAAGTLFYWNRGGIYAIVSGQISDELDVARVTRDKIQNFYDEIPETARAYARGWYDGFENRIYWFYNDSPAYDAINFRFNYNKVLILDLTLQSFYTYTISSLPDNSPFIAGMTQKFAGSEGIITYDVVQGLGSDKEDVLRGTDDVVEDLAFPLFTNIKLKMLTFVLNVDGNYEYTFSEFGNKSFTDWQAWDQFINNPNNSGADYSSHIQIGWQHYGDPIRIKKITHVTSFFNRTETGYTLVDGEVIFDNPSSCFAQVRWEWTDEDVGRWTKQEQAYRLLRTYIPENDSDPFDYGFIVVKTKLRMRGKGEAFSLRYTSEPGKDFQLLGFAVNVRAGVKV